MDKLIIKNKCNTHPKYKGIKQPKVDCYICWCVYENNQIDKTIKEEKVNNLFNISRQKIKKGILS